MGRNSHGPPLRDERGLIDRDDFCVVSVSRVAVDIDVRSFPAMRGDAIIDQRLNCDRPSSSVRASCTAKYDLLTPTSSMSGSFQCEGLVSEGSAEFFATISTMPLLHQPSVRQERLHVGLMSGVVRHMFAYLAHGCTLGAPSGLML